TRPSTKRKSAPPKRKPTEATYEIQGITVSSPSGDWLNDVRIKTCDFAQNHGHQSYCFVGDDGQDGGLKIFVADHVLGKGIDEVMRLLVTEANRRWTYTKDNGEPLGRLPTGLVGDLWVATSILCALASCAHFPIERTLRPTP